jgi:hypothetical protein
MDKAVGGTTDEMIRKTSSHLTQSQAHFVKRNIFEEEIKELRYTRHDTTHTAHTHRTHTHTHTHHRTRHTICAYDGGGGGV